MIKVTEIKGFLFSVPLADGSTLTLQAGEETTIKKSLISDSFAQAVNVKRISITEVEAETKAKEKTSGGAK